MSTLATFPFPPVAMNECRIIKVSELSTGPRLSDLISVPPTHPVSHVCLSAHSTTTCASSWLWAAFIALWTATNLNPAWAYYSWGTFSVLLMDVAYSGWTFGEEEQSGCQEPHRDCLPWQPNAPRPLALKVGFWLFVHRRRNSSCAKFVSLRLAPGLTFNLGLARIRGGDCRDPDRRFLVPFSGHLSPYSKLGSAISLQCGRLTLCLKLGLACNMEGEVEKRNNFTQDP